MKNLQLINSAIIMVFLIISNDYCLRAQERSSWKAGDKSSIKVSGESTLHDWSMRSGDIDLNASFNMEEQAVSEVKSINLNMPVKSLKSDKDDLNENAYEAMNADEYPVIEFESTDLSVKPSDDKGFNIAGKGKLKMAGVERTISINAECTKRTNQISCSGSQRINMTDFNIEPPSFMLGTMSVDEVITINYDLILRK